MFIVKFLASSLFYLLITCLTFVEMLPFMVLKLLPMPAGRTFSMRVMNTLALAWSRRSAWWLNHINPVQWHIDVPPDLSTQNWYVLICNHQSWVDIMALQNTFNGRIPFLKFFLKRELLYIPLLGIVWWALDYPFMRRGGAGSARKDLVEAREACAKFCYAPTTVTNFVEGTRFTPEKHAAQQSPYVHLLRPKAGGISVALETMGEMFAGVLDVTIAYPEGTPSFLDAMSGKLRTVTVIVRALPVPPELLPQGKRRSAPRSRVQEWLDALWQAKDAQLAQLLGHAATTAPAHASESADNPQ